MTNKKEENITLTLTLIEAQQKAIWLLEDEDTQLYLRVTRGKLKLDEHDLLMGKVNEAEKK